MAINRVSFTDQSIEDNPDITLLLLTTRPDVNEYLDPPVTPNRMRGYYNGATGNVELYITDALGRRYIKVS